MVFVRQDIPRWYVFLFGLDFGQIFLVLPQQLLILVVRRLLLVDRCFNLDLRFLVREVLLLEFVFG